MIRSLRLLAALVAALVLGAVTVQPALAEAGTGPPTPGGSDQSQQFSVLLQHLEQQQDTVNSLATQVAREQASVNTLNAKISADQRREQVVNQRMDRLARIEYERPALSLTTVLAAKNVSQLLSGVAESRLITRQQESLVDAATALKAEDEADRTAARAQLAKISKQKALATAVAVKTQAEIANLQSPQGAAVTAFAPAAASIALTPGASNPNRFSPGQCTWYVAQIYQVPWMGNANQWPAAAAATGQAEGTTPVVGAIMVSADSVFGHVSVVTSVTDGGDWTVTEMNYLGPYVTDTRQVTRASSNLVTFIY
ncbi:MAG: CHAP domain-containing protein [Candidatus Dormibacteraceae bacterium]